MNLVQVNQIETVLNELYKDAKNDYLRMMKGAAKSIFRPMQASDFKDAYLSISKDQGRDLVQMIQSNDIKNIVEFGTSFGISTLFLAQGVLATGGHIITTELIESKASQAIKNFKKAGVNDLIELRVGDAMTTLKNHTQSIDLLLLDGWKDLYLPLFRLLEPNFNADTVVYVDNADMTESKAFLYVIEQSKNYQIEYDYFDKVALIRRKGALTKQP